MIGSDTVRIWKEGARVFEGTVVSLETDGERIELMLDGQSVDRVYESDEWDELTVG